MSEPNGTPNGNGTPAGTGTPTHTPTRTPALLEGRLRAILQEAYEAHAFTAASCRIALGGEVVVRFTLGEKAHYDADGALIPPEERESADDETLYDLASLTKVFSAHTLLRLVESGDLRLDEPLAEILPAYRTETKSGVTLRHLLTHTSGLPGTWMGWRGPMAEIMRDHPPAEGEHFEESPLAGRREELAEDLLATPLGAPPGTRWEYACTGFNTAMILAERATGMRWADHVRDRTLRPLALEDVTFHPDRSRTAATEYIPSLGRGVVRGQVHDESAWSLGGECANAGLFGTADAVLALTEAIRRGGDDVLGTQMWENRLPSVLGRSFALDGDNRFGASFGLRIGELPWMGAHGGAFRGHTGFTGTSLQTDRETGLSVVLLTNRVHPTREGDGVHPLRARIAEETISWARSPTPAA